MERQDFLASSRFGLSHLGDLHFGQTLGLPSLASLGNHSCPHRQRHPVSCTMPIGFSSGFFMENLSVIILVIYHYYIPFLLPVNY